jgi:hypothetical protein
MCCDDDAWNESHGREFCGVQHGAVVARKVVAVTVEDGAARQKRLQEPKTRGEQAYIPAVKRSMPVPCLVRIEFGMVL